MISVLYNIILITNFKLIEMCIKSSPSREGRIDERIIKGLENNIHYRGKAFLIKLFFTLIIICLLVNSFTRQLANYPSRLSSSPPSSSVGGRT